MIYLTGDIHGEHDIKKLSSDKFPEGKDLTKNDYVICLGDFGFVWDHRGENDSEKYWLNWLNNKPYTFLTILGNHENYDRIYKMPQIDKFGGKVIELRPSVFILLNGYIYTINGKTFFVMGGGLSIDKHHRIEGISWWKQEEPSYQDWARARESLESVNHKVDVVLTHEVPNAVYDIFIEEDPHYYKAPYELPKNLEVIRSEMNLQYDDWFCGHHHQYRHFDKLKLTILYNQIVPL